MLENHLGLFSKSYFIKMIINGILTNKIFSNILKGVKYNING